MGSTRLNAEVFEVATIAALTHDGEGVVREGKTAFVPGALPGERVRFRRTKKHKQHDDALLVDVLEAAPERVVPKCLHFGVCGGCALQHFDPHAQLDAKQTEIRDNIERIGQVKAESWLPPMRGPVWGYRRRARLGAKYVAKKGRVVVGFRERLAPYVAEVIRCEVLAPPADALVKPLADMLMQLSIRDRVPQVEVAVADNAVALVFRVLATPSPADIAIFQQFEQAHGVRVYLQPAGLDSVHRLAAPPIPTTGDITATPITSRGDNAAAGDAPLHYRLPAFDLTLEFLPTDFIQINASINDALVSRAVEMLGLTPESVVLDLYCGMGNFSLALARVAGKVVGVEGDHALIERARANARRNGIQNAEFHVADLSKPLNPGATWLQQRYTHVLLDPPRVGAREMLSYVAHIRPQRLIYISCHPGSLARDIGILVHEHGFALKAAGALDMFPHTTHVESLAVLEPT